MQFNKVEPHSPARTWFLSLAGLSLAMLLNGCYAPIIEGGQQGYDAVKRQPLKTDVTESNDPATQYELGNTYCCQGGGPLNDLSIYDNNKATHWYCKAARHGYGPAQLQLARLYSGHAIRGLHLALRASALVGTSETDLGVALMWASVAAKNKGDGDVDDAVELRDEITQKATDAERDRASLLSKEWRTASCQWAEVFPLSKHSER
jgi:TPR repeat protein